ncbi:MAG: M28 family peptidase [Nanoarchaeota archaeon]
MTEKCLELIEKLSAIPTTTMREEGVLRFVEAYARRDLEGVRSTRDQSGNLHLVSAGSRDPQSPITLAIAVHADHPGFWYKPFDSDGKYGIMTMKGGFNPDLMQGALLDLHTGYEPARQDAGRATIIETLQPEKQGNDPRYVARLEKPRVLPATTFATLHFDQKYYEDGGLVRGVALDDQAGIAVALEALGLIIQDRPNIDFRVVVHRGEESGFIGAHNAIAHWAVPRDALVYSLETSSHRGKRAVDAPLEQIVEVGDGVVVRTGDRISPAYDPAAITLATRAAQMIMKDGLPVQEQRLYAGSCEASAYFAHGYRAGGIALPLIAWHNNREDEGTRELMLEGVHRRDLDSAVSLIVEMAHLLHKDPTFFQRMTRHDITPEQHKMAANVAEIAGRYK